MGFFKKKEHNIEEELTPVLNEDITRDEFKQMAEENFIEAVADGTDTDTTEEVSEQITNEDAEMSTNDDLETEDDFDFSVETEAETVTDIELDLPVPEPEEEKKPRMTFSEFCQKHKKKIKTALIVIGIFLVLCIALLIYGCATVPKDVMGRNIYIENVKVSGLSYEDALEKVKATTLLDDRDITVTCKGQTHIINGFDVGLTAQIEETVDKAMRYGKTGNILIDGFANALQVVAKHTVMPSADVNEYILRNKLAEFGKLIHGELREHKLEVGNGVVVITPGKTGFSGNTDRAFSQVLESIDNEDFSRIRVSLTAQAPKTLTEKDIDAFTYTNPTDAAFVYENGTVAVADEVWGRYLNIEETKKYVPQIYEGGPVVKIPFYSSEPAVKADDLRAKLFNTVLGTFKTGYGGSTGNRAANVANAAAKINEKVLAPGEVFSFNDTVGKRTVANGFFTAPEYADGQTVMGIGGGTCQVSSTLYNAVLLADLSIVYRLNHMFPVGYCPIGRDATVTDSGIDFKFENNTAYPIKITTTTGGGIITVNVIGTQRDIPHVVTFSNTSSYSASGNHVVRTYRLVHDQQGNFIRKDDLGSSTYMPHQ